MHYTARPNPCQEKPRRRKTEYAENRGLIRATEKPRSLAENRHTGFPALASSDSNK
jgi:hypothetical protein